MAKKVVPIDYTSRDFETIRKDLVQYVKRYYPQTYKDFNEASFGSLMIDLVSLVGDNLSFYLDYNANESFMKTCLEYENVLMHAKQLGYKHSPTRSSVGVIDIYMPIPAYDAGGRVGPDLDYLPKLLKGSKFSTAAGKIFTLNENIDFYSDEIEVVGDEVSADGSRVSYYILKTKASVVSGEERQTSIEIGDYRRFLKVELPDDNVGEIISVEDSQGNRCYEVDFLSQNTVYRAIPNLNTGTNSASSIMKAFPVPYRFIVERDLEKSYLVFGYGSEKEIKNNKIADPSDIALKVTGKNYISDSNFDPGHLVSSDKFGVAPANTDLFIVYRSNTADNVNTASGTLTKVISPLLEFRSEHKLSSAKVNYITTNMEVFNEDPINGDITLPTTEEVRRRAAAQFATQGRAVTKQDYISATYAMPAQFGSIKRCTISRDDDDFRRNLNLYIISEGTDNKLQQSSQALKSNLKTWLNSVRMISDSVDIYDAVLINIGIEIDIIAQDDTNKNNVYNLAKTLLYEKLTEVPPEIGESFFVSDIFKILKEVDEVLDVINVKITSKTGSGYNSTFQYDIESNLSPEGRFLHIPHNCIWEIKYTSDIVGTVR